MQILSSLVDRFESSRTRAIRRRIATAVRAGEPIPIGPRNELLNMLEFVVLAAKRKVVPAQLLWDVLGDWIMSYRLLFEGELLRIREESPGAYEGLEWIGSQFTELNRKVGLWDTPGFYRDYLPEFLEMESELDP